MGKIYKNPSPKTQQAPPVIPQHNQQHEFILPVPTVLPLDQFDHILQEAKLLVQKQEFHKALPLLLNLEVTNFDNVEVHELLADVFLHLNYINLAKEQCQIYAQLLQKDNQIDLPQLKSFNQLLSESGNFEELQQKFEEFQTQDITIDNFYQGTNIVLKLATHLMASHNYKEAEQMLINHRDRYMHFLEQEENSIRHND